MASISSIGIGSGVLTSELIDKLANAEREPTEKRLDARKEDIDAQLSEVAKLKSALSDLRLTSRLLGNPESIKSNLFSSASSGISATVTEKAATGQYQIKVANLAQAHSMATGVFSDSGTTRLGTGTLRITLGGVSHNLVIDSSNNTLQGIADKINGAPNLAATASVINTGSGYQLVLSSDSEGTKNAITLAVTDNDGTPGDASGLSQLVSGSKAFTQVVAAEDLSLEVNGLSVTRSSNTVDDLLKGITFNFTEETASAATVKVERDSGTVASRVKDLVDKYNALQSLIAETTKYDPEKQEGGVLLGESAVRGVAQQTRSVLYALVQGLESANIRSLADIGVSTNKDTGQLSFDEARFKKQLAKYPDDMVALFADQGRTSDAQVKFQTANINTKVGTYDIAVTVAATQGTNTGTVSLSNATTSLTTINSSNDQFTIQIDGISSNQITLASGSYTADQMVAELQAKIDADAKFQAAGKSLVVSLDASNQLVFTSKNYGSTSSIGFSAVEAGATTALGIAVGTGTVGKNVEGFINGAAATGKGQLLTANTADDSKGIVVEVTGSALGSRGSVSWIRGIGDQMVDTVTSFIKYEGTLSSFELRLNKQLSEIKEERKTMESRISALTERLAQQFTAADILVAQFKNTQEFLTNQLAALNPGSK